MSSGDNSKVLITSTKEVMFLTPFVCLSVGLFVCAYPGDIVGLLLCTKVPCGPRLPCGPSLTRSWVCVCITGLCGPI